MGKKTKKDRYVCSIMDHLFVYNDATNFHGSMCKSIDLTYGVTNIVHRPNANNAPEIVRNDMIDAYNTCTLQNYHAILKGMVRSKDPNKRKSYFQRLSRYSDVALSKIGNDINGVSKDDFAIGREEFIEKLL